MDLKVILLIICSVSIFEKINGFEFFECPSGDLGHRTGNFRYSSTNIVSSIIGQGYDTIDGNNGEHCAGFFYAPSYSNFYRDVDDMKCEREFSSICEIKKS